MPSRYDTFKKVLRFRGPRYLLYLLTGYLLPRLAHALVFRLRPQRLRVLAALRRRRLAATQEATRAPQGFFLRWSDWPVEESVRRAVDAAPEPPPADAPRGEIVLGAIDGDGRLESSWGVFPDFEPVSAADFVPRSRYTLDLVLLDGRVLIRKDYRGQRAVFLDEWYALSRLQGRANVPTVHAAVEERCWLYRSYIGGDTVNDLLVQAGARIRLVETRDDEALGELRGAARLEAILERGTRRLAEVMPPETLGELERQVDRVHRAAVAGLSLTFGNVVLDRRGAPWLVDFDGAETYRSTRPALFAYRRNQDRIKLNRVYSRDLLTESQARRLLRELFHDAYAPIDLGQGLATRGFWSVDSGTGRWEFLLRDTLGGLIEGQRILDLGSHHGLLPLLMLAAGARQVVAVEKSSERVAQAGQLRRLFEWRCMRRFGLDLRCADMRAILDGDWGRFDLVTAFCSLYYLEEPDMRRVVRRAADLAPILVLQAKTDTRGAAADNKAEKSSLRFLRSLLEEHGFPRVDVVAPDGYSRPLLIGRRQDPALDRARNL